jgi:hypothetical protein
MPIIAIFDNDTAAYDSIKNINKSKLPKNITYLTYPDFNYLNSYPTLGPTGKRALNTP